MEKILTVGSRWRRYRGCCFGISAPTLTGFATVNTAGRADPARFNALLENLTGEEAPPTTNGMEPTSSELVHCLLHWTNALQRINNVIVPNCSAIVHVEAVGQETRIQFAIPYLDEGCAKRTFIRLAALVNRIASNTSASGQKAEAGAALRELRKEHKCHALPGVTLAHLYRAAYEANVPVCRMARDVVHLGMGANGSRFRRSVSERTSGVGLAIARDKFETSRLLRAAGLPAAEHQLVHGEAELLSMARSIGFPLVIKPADMDRGIGVVANIRNENTLTASYRSSLAYSKRILLERHVPGKSHRVTVVDGAVVKITRKISLGVTGDGRNTVETLISFRNGNTLQRRGRAPAISEFIAINDELRTLLADQRLTMESVLDEGRFLSLRGASNSSRGAVTERLSIDVMHPDNLAICEAASEVLSLDIVGVDLICEDIGTSWRDSPLVICELNGGPQLGSDAAKRLLDERISGTGRIPVAVLLYRREGQREIAQKLQEVAASFAYRDTSGAGGVAIAGRFWPGRFESDYEAADSAIRNRGVTALLCAVHERELLSEGLPVHVVDRIFALDGVGEVALSSARSYGGSIETLR